jgi:hypothetical protein
MPRFGALSPPHHDNHKREADRLERKAETRGKGTARGKRGKEREKRGACEACAYANLAGDSGERKMDGLTGPGLFFLFASR